MTVVFQLKGMDSWFTTDPELVKDSKNLKQGDYVRLPDGAVYKLEKDFPTLFVLVNAMEVPLNAVLLEAKEWDSYTGKLKKDAV